ncbi:class I SAM-dependent methyltransferase [Brevibacterium sp. FME37]|uniref:class I SAM-dependent methyltransferase n=1 Tax=Brevibacterium sp. FME37 TaxID=2742607 RepID=UPI0018667786|nr:class I SAM-dependent methyltransferase [Brevibacterium sp. FME37]
MPDALFSDPRLAGVYDPLDPDRSDLDMYVDVVKRFGASKVLDVGCGTGTLASLLAELENSVLGLDPASASIDIAQSKVVSDFAEFIVAEAPDIADDPARHRGFDLATMTANVAQVFLDDDEWLATLRAIHSCLRPAGRLVFEARRPSDRAWIRWTKELTWRVVDVDGEGPVETWVQVTEVNGEYVSFDSPTIFHSDGERINSTSTLRFRTEDAVKGSLTDAGFGTIDVHDLPYAPGRGWLFIASA